MDIDIAKFFDRVNHDILMQRIGKTIRDKRVLGLIGKYLRAGVMVEGVVVPLSPLLANIYLDPLDRELERRGHAFSRYADDCNIYVGSEASANRVMESICRWIEKCLRLQVNASKSGVGRTWERKFLGFRITRKGEIEVSPESLERFKKRVRELWRGNQSLTSKQLRDQWVRYVRGWWNYYRLAQWRDPVLNLEGWTRRHMRKCFWIRWHGPKGRRRKLSRLGVRGRALGTAWSRRGAWRIAAAPALQQALRPDHFAGRYVFSVGGPSLVRTPGVPKFDFRFVKRHFKCRAPANAVCFRAWPSRTPSTLFPKSTWTR